MSDESQTPETSDASEAKSVYKEGFSLFVKGDVDVEQDGGVVGIGPLPTGAEHAAEGGDVLGSGLLREVDGGMTLRDDAERAERGVGREEAGHPLRVVDALLDDPIAAVGGVPVEEDAHPSLLVAVLHDDGGRLERRTDGDAAPLALIFPNDGCAIPVYEKDWSGLDDAQQEAAKALEYDEEMWNNDQDPIWMDDTEWTHLSAEAQMNILS